MLVRSPWLVQTQRITVSPDDVKEEMRNSPMLSFPIFLKGPIVVASFEEDWAQVVLGNAISNEDRRTSVCYGIVVGIVENHV